MKYSSTRKEGIEDQGDVSRTPTKRVKYGTVQGVDLSTVEVEEGVSASARRRRKEDTSAFMALKPDHTTQKVVKEVETNELPDEEKEYLLSIREKRKTRAKGSRAGLKRKDWTFREGIWDSESIQRRNEIILEKVCR